MSEQTAPDSALGVAVAQFAPGADPRVNLAEIERMTRLAVARGASLVVFPEYSSYFTPVMGFDWVEAAQPLDGSFVQALVALANDTACHIVAGLVEVGSDPTRVRNTIVAVAPELGLVAKYRKMHLYDAFGTKESDWVEAGPSVGSAAEPEIFELGGLRVGLQTCYDIRFPEVTRRLVDAGAELVLVPAEWVRGPLKEHHWRTLCTARALENTVYLAAADHVPPVGVGNSFVIDPMGVELVTIGESVDVSVAWLTRERLTAVRTLNPALALRRFRVVPR